MSAGNFVKTRYAASYGAGTQIHPIRLQPESIAADFGGDANEPPAGAVNNPISAVVSRGARAKGLRPRFVTLKIEPEQAAPPEYASFSTTKLVVLTPGVFNAITEGSTVAYLGTTWTVIGKTNEDAQ